MWLSHASARNASSNENPQLVEKGADSGKDRGRNRSEDQDAADRCEPTDERGNAIPLEDAERERGDGEGRRNVAEWDRQEKDDGEQQAGRADEALRGGMQEKRQPGFEEPLARARAGLSLAVSRAKKSRWIERSRMKAGIHRVGRPSINCAVMKRSGAPRTADVPGGSGRMLGAAKTSIRAPKARSPKALSTSLMAMVGLGRLARSLRTSENRCRGSGPSSEDGAAARLLEGSGMVSVWMSLHI